MIDRPDASPSPLPPFPPVPPTHAVILETLTSFIKQCHAYPLLEVRNRALVVSQAGLDGPGGRRWGAPAMTVDKYYASNEDLLLYVSWSRVACPPVMHADAFGRRRPG